MSAPDPVDATEYDYEEWIRFAFDHPVSEERWYVSTEFECVPEKVIAYYTRLFLDPGPLDRYDDDRLDQGFWFVVSWQLGEWIWEDDIPLLLRADCIGAMPTFFRKFFLARPLDDSCHMWWDHLRAFGESPDPVIVEATLQALEQVLELPARHCHESALHGLGHLEHERKETIIRAFLRRHPDLDDSLVRYAEEAIAGKVL
jgi:hypothetical protein